MTLRGNSLWVTIYRSNHVVQFHYGSVGGDCPDFHVWGTTDTNLSSSVGSEELLFVLVDDNGHSHLWVPRMHIANPPQIISGRMMNVSFSTATPEDAEKMIQHVDIEPLCRTWAVYGEFYKNLYKNVSGEGTRHTAYLATIHGRPSNIGVSYYDANSGEHVSTEPMAVRYTGKYIGRTASWQEVSETQTFSIEVQDLLHQGDVTLKRSPFETLEFHFPRNRVPLYTEGQDIFGSTKETYLCGISGISGDLIVRKLWRAPYRKGHPLSQSMKRTKFKEIYSPTTAPALNWMCSADNPIGDEDMNDAEKEIVGKWFSGHLTNLIRRGESLSDEEIEFAKRLGIYKGK